MIRESNTSYCRKTPQMTTANLEIWKWNFCIETVKFGRETGFDSHAGEKCKTWRWVFIWRGRGDAIRTLTKKFPFAGFVDTFLIRSNPSFLWLGMRVQPEKVVYKTTFAVGIRFFFSRYILFPILLSSDGRIFHPSWISQKRIRQ